jgi:hypothetical protein
MDEAFHDHDLVVEAEDEAGNTRTLELPVAHPALYATPRLVDGSWEVRLDWMPYEGEVFQDGSFSEYRLHRSVVGADFLADSTTEIASVSDRTKLRFADPGPGANETHYYKLEVLTDDYEIVTYAGVVTTGASADGTGSDEGGGGGDYGDCGLNSCTKTERTLS